jgi:hypothetical protein
MGEMASAEKMNISEWAWLCVTATSQHIRKAYKNQPFALA